MLLTRIKVVCVVLCLTGFREPWNTSDVSAVLHGGMAHQGFIKSVNDANLMFEFLWRGLEIDADNNVVMLDQEMASMRQGRVFLSLINDSIPKTVPAMEKLLAMLEEQDNSFAQARFETLLLGTIYSAYQARNQRLESEQQAWIDILGRFANVTFVQLRRY
ncbi:Protein FAM180A [Labeo rohita]|uniref:Protein FAM180A n=1 Tax=Labeo rohita TaxID=84645 RepID=A0ABQ8LV69_LABRO|nr:protein FAM180A [Labeo rohita]KAI2653548.1 Protein FAM180A [Labeo rohita]